MAELENKKLDDEQLEGTAGGYGGYMQPFVTYNCQLTGYYWGTTFMGGGPNTALIGQFMQVVYNPGAQGACHYQLMSGGQYMGWTVAGNFRLI